MCLVDRPRRPADGTCACLHCRRDARLVAAGQQHHQQRIRCDPARLPPEKPSHVLRRAALTPDIVVARGQLNGTLRGRVDQASPHFVVAPLIRVLPSEIAPGEASITREPATGVRIVLSIDAQTEAVIRISAHALPGWRVTVDGQIVPPQMEPGLGFLEVTVPRGRHVVEARFENTPVRAVANTVSVVSLVALVAFVPLSARWRA